MLPTRLIQLVFTASQAGSPFGCILTTQPIPTQRRIYHQRLDHQFDKRDRHSHSPKRKQLVCTSSRASQVLLRGSERSAVQEVGVSKCGRGRGSGLRRRKERGEQGCRRSERQVYGQVLEDCNIPLPLHQDHRATILIQPVAVLECEEHETAAECAGRVEAALRVGPPKPKT